MPNKYLTKQEIFDKAYLGLMDQGFEVAKKDVGEGALVCAYKTDNGLRCAVGQLIDDKHYTKDFEGLPPSYLIDMGVLPDVSTHEGPFLFQLQKCHDYSTGDMQNRLKEFAKDYNLTVPEKQTDHYGDDKGPTGAV